MKASRRAVRSLKKLTQRGEFLAAAASGRKWVSTGLVLQIRDNDGLGRRFGLTASKKLSKSAVLRNRARRRLRSLAWDTLAAHAADNTDYVLIARPGTLDKSYADLEKDLRWCLKRLGVLVEAG